MFSTNYKLHVLMQLHVKFYLGICVQMSTYNHDKAFPKVWVHYSIASIGMFIQQHPLFVKEVHTICIHAKTM